MTERLKTVSYTHLDVYKRQGPDYAIMVSDALMAKGTPVGSKYLFGGNEIIIYPDGSAHLTATGGLAGSTLNINKGLRILVEEALVPFNYALNSCTDVYKRQGWCRSSSGWSSNALQRRQERPYSSDPDAGCCQPPRRWPPE